MFKPTIMRNLITGGLGFIGSSLATELLARGEQVCIVDNLSTGSLDNLPRHAVWEGPLDITKDVGRVTALAAGCDRIFHLAACVGVHYVIENPDLTWKVNVEGTKHILDIAETYRLPVFIASSSEVYGDRDSELYETDATVQTNSTTVYGKSKWESEVDALNRMKAGRLTGVIGRLFNVVGQKQTWKYGMVLPTFIKQALRDEDITIFGDGSQCRSFAHVDVVTHDIVALMNCDSARNHMINIGSDRSLCIMDVAVMVKEVVGSNSRIVTVPYKRTIRVDYGNIQARKPNLDQLRSLIERSEEPCLKDVISEIRDYMWKSEDKQKFVSGWR